MGSAPDASAFDRTSAGERMSRARDQRMADGEERLLDHLRLRREGKRDTGKIDFARHERRHDAVDGALGDAYLDPGKLLMKGGDDGRQDHRDPHRPRADAQHAGHALFKRADLGQGVAVFEFHQLDAARQHFAMPRERDAGGQALEQRDTDGLFQLPNASRQGGLADIQRFGGYRYVPLLDNSEKMTQQPRMHDRGTFGRTNRGGTGYTIT